MSGLSERVVKPEPDPQAARRREEREESEYAYVRSHEDFEAEEDDYELDDGY